MRLIPAPKVGRWRVWKVSDYPTGGRQLVGRYRLRTSARIVAWSLNRQRITPMHHFEARPVRLSRRTADHCNGARR